MTHIEEQKIVHAISGIAQSINTILALVTEMSTQRAKVDEEMLLTLKLISRKH